MPSKRRRATYHQECLAIVSDPHTYELFHDLMAQTARLSELAGRGPDGKPTFTVATITRGDRRYAAHCAKYLVDVFARTFHNRKRADEELRRPGVWRELAYVVERVGAITLPAKPPTAEDARQWRLSRFPRDLDTGFTEPPAPLVAILDGAIARGVARAKAVGHFPDDAPLNFADPSVANLFACDGTYLAPYSNAEVCDLDGTTVKVHSRAADINSVRQQSYNDDFDKDGRRTMGVLHVVATSDTDYGRVFLGVNRLPGGENKTAVKLVEKIKVAGGPGVHSVVYDKALAGWPAEYLMARYGVNTIMKAVAAEEGLDPEAQDIVLDAEGARRRHDSRRAASRKTKAVREAAGRDAVNTGLRGQLLKARDAGDAFGVGLPLGTSRYLSSAGNVESVHSAYQYYKTLAHTSPGGQTCSHELYLDDGALWEVAYDPARGTYVKVQRVRCWFSEPQREPEGIYLRHSKYALACATAHTVHRFEDILIPWAKRCAPTRLEQKDRGRARLSARLQPIARCDPKFFKVYGKRSGIESWFSWFKDRLLPGHRAASLDLNHQLLDMVYGGLITNALTLRSYRLGDRIGIGAR